LFAAPKSGAIKQILALGRGPPQFKGYERPVLWHFLGYPFPQSASIRAAGLCWAIPDPFETMRLQSARWTALWNPFDNGQT
jgi:hypothetical protein